MAGEPQIVVIGNLADDPSLRFTASGHAVANFVIAQTPRSYDKSSQQYVDDETLWVRCSVWRDVAENVAETLTKGMRVIAHGYLKARSFEDKQGNQRTNWEMTVDEIGPSLRWATAQVNRNPRQGGGAGNASAGSAWGADPGSAWGAPTTPPASSPWAGQPESHFNNMTGQQQGDTPPPF